MPEGALEAQRHEGEFPVLRGGGRGAGLPGVHERLNAGAVGNHNLQWLHVNLPLSAAALLGSAPTALTTSTQSSACR